ncbi:unnamed protein product [Cyprideis torosa]|uniref:ZW10 C-terminal helical domain-containing protein n=1 Tax=Cyprideis torosa TaxID=163714 RepID=A0A7R8ZNS3_9CRUS|nr:unnamed protein product [Cyprideis torosa]CAG0886973.1 unnamed protein product [Cyprideis torosa]
MLPETPEDQEEEGLPPMLFKFSDLAPLLRNVGLRRLQQLVKTIRESLLQILKADGDGLVLGMGRQEAHGPQVKRAVTQVKALLQSQHKTLAGVLPDSEYRRVMAKWLQTVSDELLRQILAVDDYFSQDTESLVPILSQLLQDCPAFLSVG